MIKRIVKNIIIKLENLFYKIDSKDIFYDNKWLSDLSKIYFKFFRICPLIFFLKTYTNQIEKRLNKENTQLFIDNILNNFSNFDDRTKIIAIYLLYCSGLIDENAIQIFVKFAKETKNKNYRYYLTMDFSKITFFEPKCFYKDFYLDRRALLEQICLENSFIRPNIKKEKNGKRRLCVITYCAKPTIFNSVQRVAEMFVNGLKEKFDEVLVLSLDSFAVTKNEYKDFVTQFKRPFAVRYRRKLEKRFTGNSKIKFVHKDNFKNRSQEALDIIYNFNPTAILDMSDEYSVISYIYSKDFPTFYLPLRSHVSSSFYNYILGADWEFKKLNDIYRITDEEKICNWIFPEYVPEKKRDYARNEFNLSEDSFIILTIGNNDNLITEELADGMCKVLIKNPKMVWMFVGGDAPVYIHKKYESLLKNSQIIEHGFETNLAGLCSISNMVLRPNTTGSSGATAIAAQQGLPIAMTNYVCDPMRWLGADYTTIDNYKDLVNEVNRLYNDKEYYQEQSAKVLAKVNKATDFERAWNELDNIIVEKCNEESKK